MVVDPTSWGRCRWGTDGVPVHNPRYGRRETGTMEGCRPSSTLSMSVNQLPSLPWFGEISKSTCSRHQACNLQGTVAIRQVGEWAARRDDEVDFGSG